MSFRRNRGETDPGTGTMDPSTGTDSPPATTRGQRTDSAGNMLPGRGRRRFAVERVLVRLVATAGIVGVGVVLGAILVSNKVQGWITGLVIALVTVVLAALLWSSRQL